jgi:hypothetical protein
LVILRKRRGSWPPEPPRTLSTHYTNANQAEIAVNGQFIRASESAFGPRTQLTPQFAATAFVAFFTEARKLERLDNRGPTFEIEFMFGPAPDLSLSTKMFIDCIFKAETSVIDFERRDNQSWPFSWIGPCR